jgi:hypothetical protein
MSREAPAASRFVRGQAELSWYCAACCKTRSNAYKIDSACAVLGDGLGDGLGAGGRYPDWCGCHRVVAECGPALASASLHGRAPNLPAHGARCDQGADAARHAAHSARHRVADDAARRRNCKPARPTAWAGDHMPARLGRTDRAAYWRRPLSQAFPARPRG